MMMSLEEEQKLGHGTEDGPSGRDSIHIKVRCTSGMEVRIVTYGACTVNELKAELSEKDVRELKDTNLRLIYMGKVMSSGRATLSSYGVEDGCCLLAVKARRGRSNQANGDNTPPQQPRGPYGFDRLVESGFSLEEVTQFRTQFHASSPSAQLLLAPILGGGRSRGDEAGRNITIDDTRARHLRELEETWMNEQNSGIGVLGGGGTTGGFDLESGISSPVQRRRGGEVENGQDQHQVIMFGPDGLPLQNHMTSVGMGSMAVTSYGNNADMLLGLVVGFLIPWLPVILLIIDEFTTNRSFKVGLVTGVACNISMGLVRYAAFA